MSQIAEPPPLPHAYLVPFPSRAARRLLPEDEWMSGLDLWSEWTMFYLRLTTELFEDALLNDSPFLGFVTSYVHEEAADFKRPDLVTKDHELHKNVFRLVHRTLVGVSPQFEPFLEWSFLADLSIIYKTMAFSNMFQSIWQRSRDKMKDQVARLRETLILSLTHGPASSMDDLLSCRIICLVLAMPPIGTALMTGTELLDYLADNYGHIMPILQLRLAAFAFYCLRGLLKEERPKTSLLCDCIYSLNSSYYHKPLLLDMVNNTPLVRMIRSHAEKWSSRRAQNVLEVLESIQRSQSVNKPEKPCPHCKIGVGNFSAVEAAWENSHFTAQLRELFPALGDSFVTKLREEYKGNVQVSLAHLLDNDHPPHLASLADHNSPSHSPSGDRSKTGPATAGPSHVSRRIESLSHTTAPSHTTSPSRTASPSHKASPSRTALPSHTTLPSDAPNQPSASTQASTSTQQRTIHDNDAFANLAVSPSSINIGRRNSSTADALLASRPANSKAKILNALAAFQPDDDERDDTYDLADVGGSVDTGSRRDGSIFGPYSESNQTCSSSTPARLQGHQRDITLYEAYRQDQTLFARDAETRRSKRRIDLREATGMTDEAIEGWAIMLTRDPVSLQRLEARFATAGVGGRQTALERTAWSGRDDDDEEPRNREDSSDNGEGRVQDAAGRSFRGRGRGRGRGPGYQGRGRGDVAGPSGQKDMQIQRQRKEAGRGGRANHNRRDQRARKMARGGFPG